MPSVWVVGTDGRVRFQYVNPDYKVRLSPDVLLAVGRRGAGRNPRESGEGGAR